MSFRDALTAFRLGREEMRIEHEIGKVDKELAKLPKPMMPRDMIEEIRFAHYGAVERECRRELRALEGNRNGVHAQLAYVEGAHPVAYLLGNLSRPVAVAKLLSDYVRAQEQPAR